MLNRILTALNDHALAFNRDEGKYSFISANIYELTGYQSNDFENNINLWQQLIDARDMEQVAGINDMPAPNMHINLTYRITTAWGKTKWVSEKRTLFTDEQSGNSILLSILKDVQREDEAKYNQEQSITGYSILFDHNPSPMWIYDVATLRILKINAAATKTYGYTEEEFLSMTIRDIRLRADYESFNNFINDQGIAEATFKGFSSSGIWKHVTKNGDIIYVEINGDSIKHKNYDCRIIVATNITERIHYQEQTKLREQFLNSLIDSQTNFLIRINMQGRYTFVNKQFSKTFGYTDSDIIGKHFSITTIPEENHLCEAAFVYCINNKDKITKLLHKKPDKWGGLHDTEWEFIAITDEKGNVTEVQGIGQDVTERIKTSQAILDQNERLQNIASLSSHELRRPVANMLGLINIIDRDNFYNPENKEIIEQLLYVGNEIDTVIHQIVDTTFSDRK